MEFASSVPPVLAARARAVLEAAQRAGLRVATAESCTGGLVMASLTEIPGSSATAERGFVTYTNEAKVELLGVSEDTLKAFGAVSEATAREMALGALARSRADLAVSITGIAGPGGGGPSKPVGMVCFAIARRDGGARALTRRYGARGRATVRGLSALEALALLERAAAGGR